MRRVQKEKKVFQQFWQIWFSWNCSEQNPLNITPCSIIQKDPKHGEWSQKLTSPLSLSAIGDRFHTKHHSVLDDSFLKAEGIGGKDKQKQWNKIGTGITHLFLFPCIEYISNNSTKMKKIHLTCSDFFNFFSLSFLGFSFSANY